MRLSAFSAAKTRISQSATWVSHKTAKAEVHSIVEAVARKLPPCHGSLMARSERLVWIKSVL